MFLSRSTLYIAYYYGPNFHETLTFLGQAGKFLSFLARRSSAARSSMSDLTVAGIRKRDRLVGIQSGLARA